MKLTRLFNPPSIIEKHKAAGGTCLERFTADVHDGMLRLLLSVEPDDGDKMATRISISIGDSLGSPGTIRRPDKQECLAAISELTARHVMENLVPIPRLIEVDVPNINDPNIICYEG